MGSATINLSAVIDTFGGTTNAALSFTAQVMRGGQPALRVDDAQAVLPAPLSWYWSGTAWAPSVPALTDVDPDCHWLVELASIDGNTRLTRTVVLPLGHGAAVDFGDLTTVDPATLVPTPSAVAGWASTQALVLQLQAQVAAVQAGILTDLPEWQPATAYTAGELVLNPSGQIVQANSGFTSGASYNASNWTILSLTLATVQALIAAQAASDSATYVHFGPSLPSLPSGTEYVWNKTDGAGTLLDIVSGVA